jgi:hypothetical protein
MIQTEAAAASATFWSKLPEYDKHNSLMGDLNVQLDMTALPQKYVEMHPC